MSGSLNVDLWTVGYVAAAYAGFHVVTSVCGKIQEWWSSETPLTEKNKQQIAKAAADIARRNGIVGPMNEAIVQACGAMKVEEAGIAEDHKHIEKLKEELKGREERLEELRRKTVEISQINPDSSLSLSWNAKKIKSFMQFVSTFVGEQQMRQAFGTSSTPGSSQTSSTPAPMTRLPTAGRAQSSQGTGQMALVQKIIKEGPNPYVQFDQSTPVETVLRQQLKAVTEFLYHCRYNPRQVDTTRAVWKSDDNKDAFLAAALKDYQREEQENLKLLLFRSNPSYLSQSEMQRQHQKQQSIQKALQASQPG